MRSNRWLPAIAVAAFLAMPVISSAHDKAHGDMKWSPGSKEMHESMMHGAKESMSMRPTGDIDRDFAMMMKKHHEDALKMARIQLDQGKDPKMKEMARMIIESQRKEIAQFDEWLKMKR